MIENINWIWTIKIFASFRFLTRTKFGFSFPPKKNTSIHDLPSSVCSLIDTWLCSLVLTSHALSGQYKSFLCIFFFWKFIYLYLNLYHSDPCFFWSHLWLHWVPNMQRFMGVIDIYNASSLCFIKPNTSVQQLVVPQSQRPSCSIEGNRRRVVAMASIVPSVEHVNEGKRLLTGDSFIRPHLRELSPYQPILPFEVLQSDPFPYFPFGE